MLEIGYSLSFAWKQKIVSEREEKWILRERRDGGGSAVWEKSLKIKRSTCRKEKGRAGKKNFFCFQ